MKSHGIFQRFLGGHKPQQQQGSGKFLIFKGNDENLIKNGETLLKERISLFDGRTNSVRCFSVDDLNSMRVNNCPIIEDGVYKSYAGVWDDKSVLVKVVNEHSIIHAKEDTKLFCREIAVATQMRNHRSVHKLLGCCLNTNYPVLVYEWAENGTLPDRISRYKEQYKEPLAWKDRLRIAWDIAHAISYLHTAFRRTIVHRDLKPSDVFLDQDDSARLSGFRLCISIPEGKKHVEDVVMGTRGYAAPEYLISGRLTESIDVFSFGELLLALLTGKLTVPLLDHNQLCYRLVDWVSAKCLDDIVDPAITTNGPVSDEHIERQLKEFVELALRCASDEKELRPTMDDVATQLQNIIMLSSDSR